MHGVIFAELRKYVEARLGDKAWDTLLKEAGIGPKAYIPVQEYPDAEALALVATASRLTGKPAGAILEDFGEFIAPDLLKMYGGMIKPEWRTLDLIERTEEKMHKAVRFNNPTAKPPELRVTRPTPTEVVVNYTSPRKLCSLAKGIAKGVAKHYKETIKISEPTCMLRGAPSCNISVILVK